MAVLIVVDEPDDWPAPITGAWIVSARTYLTDPYYSGSRGNHVYNLCESYRYQQMGYYVSLLATARGHRPLPDIRTIQALKSRSIVRFVADDLEEQIQRNLRPLKSRYFSLSIYFGRNPARRYARLAKALYNMFPAPLLRAAFVRRRNQWQLDSLRVVPLGEVPKSHRDFLLDVLEEHFAQRSRPRRRTTPTRYDLAILVNDDAPDPPSDARALKRFEQAARKQGCAVEFITKDDSGRIAEFDALFIRETTRVDHHTYRFAQRAAIEGMVVIDDPESIIRCTNKVYLAELMRYKQLAIPQTLIIHRDNVDRVAGELGLPCILKQPDSAFSQGVIKVDDETELREALRALLARSDLVIGQSFLPTDFDWRIGILDGKPLFACRYYMARRHWQIIKRSASGRVTEGRYDGVPIADVPKRALNLALKAGAAIGNGLYGVDIKETGGRCYVIEVNDNPSIDSGVEDQVLGKALYDQVVGVIVERIESSRGMHA